MRKGFWEFLYDLPVNTPVNKRFPTSMWLIFAANEIILECNQVLSRNIKRFVICISFAKFHACVPHKSCNVNHTQNFKSCHFGGKQT